MRTNSSMRFCFEKEGTQIFDRGYGQLFRGNDDIEDNYSCQTTQEYGFDGSPPIMFDFDSTQQTQYYSDTVIRGPQKSNTSHYWKEQTGQETKRRIRRNMIIEQPERIDWERYQIELNAIRFRDQKETMEEQQKQLEEEWKQLQKWDQRREYLLEGETLEEYEEEEEKEVVRESGQKQEQFNINVQTYQQELEQQQEGKQEKTLDNAQNCQGNVTETNDTKTPACCVEKKKRGRKRKVIDCSLLNVEKKENESQLNNSDVSLHRDDEKNLTGRHKPEETKTPILAEDLEAQIDSNPLRQITKNIQKFKIVVTKKCKSEQTTCQSKICGICLSDPEESIVGVIQCSHEFCYDCILQWSKVTNRCPMCRAEFKKIQKQNQRDEDGSEKAVAVASKKQKIPEDDEFYWVRGIDEICYICQTDYDKHQLIVCAHCEVKICHTYCDEKLLEDSLPDYDWFCHECRTRSELQD